MPEAGFALRTAATTFFLVATAFGSTPSRETVAEPETESARPAKRARNRSGVSCVIELTRDSLEFENASVGFVRVLTALATSHGRVFHRKGASEAFFRELADCLPKKARSDAQAMIGTVGLREFDADNADVNPTALSRLLSAFRALVIAWNKLNVDDPIPLRDLHTFDSASAAVERMKLAHALKDRARRPDIEIFQDRRNGSYSVFLRLGTASRIAFTRDARTLFERLWKALPDTTDAALREAARVAIQSIRDTDGSNAARQQGPADRILDAWKAVAAAYGVTGDASDGTDTVAMLEKIGATRILEPPVSKFVRGKDSGLQYVRTVVRKKRGTSSAEAIREFVVETATLFLSPDDVTTFRALVAALPWARPEPRAARRRAQVNGADALKRQGNAPVRFSVRLPGDNESRCVFEAMALLVQMWNRAHEADRSKQIDAESLHSPSALFQVFRTMQLDVEPPKNESPSPVIAGEQGAMRESQRPHASEETEPDVAVEPLPEPEPQLVVAPPPRLAPPVDVRRQRVRHFQSAGGGLAYVRGLVRQLKLRFETPYFLRDFVHDRTGMLPSPYREAARTHLASIPWKIDDPETAFHDEAVADRVLAAFEFIAGIWNECMPSTGAATIATDPLVTAQGMYTALLWMGPGGLEPWALGERAGSGFVFDGARPLPPPVASLPLPRYVPPPPPPPRPTSPPPPRPQGAKPATPPAARPKPVSPPPPAAPKKPRPAPLPLAPTTVERPSNPLDAIATVDPEEPELAHAFLAELRAKIGTKRDGASADKLAAIYTRTAALPRTAQFRLAVLKTLCAIAPPKQASVVVILRDGLKSKEELLQIAIAEAAAGYDHGKDATVRYQLTRLALRKDALGKAAEKALASGN